MKKLDDAEFEEISKVVRHISFDDADYLWGEGTGFFVLHNNEFYFITAMHNLLKGGKLYANSLVVAERLSKAIVPFDLMLLGNETGAEQDDEQSDFAIFRIDKARSTSLGIDFIHVIDTGSQAAFGRDIPDGTMLRCAGYPTTDEPYDWENKKKSAHLLVKVGHKNGSTLGKGTGTLLGEPSKLDYSGMSGGPVFALVDTKWLWVGIAIRASGSVGVINYLSADLVLKVLQHAPTVLLSQDTPKPIRLNLKA